MKLNLIKKYPLLLTLMTILVFLFSDKQSYSNDAPLQIDIMGGRVQAMPIAVSFFSVDEDLINLKLKEQIPNLISKNLVDSGLFMLLDRNAYMQKPSQLINIPPKFRDWRIIDAQALITGNIEKKDDSKIKVNVQLWDVYGERRMFGISLSSKIKSWRRISHIISDKIYERLTGEEGYFDTRIVYVAESGKQKNKIKRLAIMDQDGANHRFLTDGSDLVLTPRFSPTMQEITYLAYYNKKPRVYIFNIDTGQQEVLGDFPGMTFAPRFSPDGSKVIMSLAKKGVTDIYTMDLATRRVQQLTQSPSIDTSPTYSPDGSRIVFNSDRGGTQQLYVMNSNGRAIKRISFGKGRYATPVWSPRGDLIAFTKMFKGKFFIGVMQPNGKNERILADGYLVESPTWAPNGRVLIFFRQMEPTANGVTRSVKLFSIDLTGYNEREIVTPLDASDPAWSPLNP